MKISETIVVEGRDDTAAVKRAVEAHTIETHGFGISAQTWQLLQKAYDTTGIIVFTDPDFAGEQIRRRITARFPNAGQAYLDRQDALAGGDIGIENGAPEDIRTALSKFHRPQSAQGDQPVGEGLLNREDSFTREDSLKRQTPFTREDLIAAGMWGGPRASQRRSAAGKALGIGYGNCNGFLRKLNQFMISKEEFNEVIHHLGNS